MFLLWNVKSPQRERQTAASHGCDAAGVAYRLLNGRQDEDEATIVAQAGQPGAVTIATNMAGRGTDIKLAPEVVPLGGLHVIAAQRHESGRIDRQLIGRCARQGDPGSVRTYASLEDDLVQRYGPKSLLKLLLHIRSRNQPESNLLAERAVAILAAGEIVQTAADGLAAGPVERGCLLRAVLGPYRRSGSQDEEQGGET